MTVVPDIVDSLYLAAIISIYHLSINTYHLSLIYHLSCSGFKYEHVLTL